MGSVSLKVKDVMVTAVRTADAEMMSSFTFVSASVLQFSTLAFRYMFETILWIKIESFKFFLALRIGSFEVFLSKTAFSGPFAVEDKPECIVHGTRPCDCRNIHSFFFLRTCLLLEFTS